MRLSTLGAVGVAYVLGARAGRDRYEQIRALAQQAARRLEAYGEHSTLAQRSGIGSADDAAARRR